MVKHEQNGKTIKYQNKYSKTKMHTFFFPKNDLVLNENRMMLSKLFSRWLMASSSDPYKRTSALTTHAQLDPRDFHAMEIRHLQPIYLLIYHSALSQYVNYSNTIHSKWLESLRNLKKKS